MSDPTNPQGEPATEEAATSPAPEAPTTPPDPGTSDAGFQTPFNISDVPEAMRPHVEAYNRQLQGAYTRKTQELAEQRKALAGAEDLYQRLYSDDETTRDEAVREALQAGGWDDLTAAEQQAVLDASDTEQSPAPGSDEALNRLEAVERQLAARDQADEERAHQAYLDDFTQRYTGAVDAWAKANGYESGDKLPEYLQTQIAGYARGTPVLEEDGRPYADMETALKLMDADRAAYLTSKDPGDSPNVAAVSAAPAPNRPRTDKERLALANAIAARHV